MSRRILITYDDETLEIMRIIFATRDLTPF